ncbi:hypothetical protein AQF52_2207 [Streptomyces venezuelae]|nr:hypothetical protein AQF52_2207 [Streptomyces venezuelae]
MAVRADAGAGAGLVPAFVEAPGPPGAGAGQPDGADDRHERDQGPEHGHPELPLHQRDEDEEEVHHQGEDERAPVLALVRRHVVDAERREAAERESHQRRGEDDHLDALAALVRPVHVVEVEDQRELVEDEPRTDPEEDGEDTRAHAVPVAGHRTEPAEDGEDDAGHDVMDVETAGGDVPEGALPGPDEPGDGTGDQECQDEGGQSEQHRELARLDDVAGEPVTHATPFRYARYAQSTVRGRRLPCPDGRPAFRLRHPHGVPRPHHPLGP